VLHYDARERHFATAVEALVARIEGEAISLAPRARPLPDVAYGRVVRKRGTWLQYWFLYEQNPQDRGVLRTGRHEGDWEMVQLELGSGAATYAQHRWAARCGWTGHVYVANASHASYPDRGEHGRPWPDPDDEARGDGRVVRPEVRPFGPWVRWPGRWGRAEARWWIPAEAPSPEGPAFQEDGAWEDPAARHAEARPCDDGAPPHPWPVYAVAAALALGLIVVVARKVAR
jgi:hypothetical protein